MKRPRVLMVTGAYFPELSGAGLQCREVVRALRDRVVFTVLTTSTTPSLATAEEVDGIPIHRVRVDAHRVWSSARAAAHLAQAIIRLRQRFDIVHLHGFSRKTVLMILLAKALRKKILLKLTSAGHDDPLAIRAAGRLRFWWYAQADLFLGVSPRLQELYHASGLPREKFRLVHNGVDLRRFRPGTPGERNTLRRELGLPEELRLILFVGFFSREKGPHLLFEAWMRLQGDGLPATGLVYVGSTRSRYYEVDGALAPTLRARARELGLEARLAFVEATHEIEKYYRAADIFVLPSLREGLSNALLEAMAAGLPCVAAQLPRVSDVLIEHGVNGFLVPPGDVAALGGALQCLLEQPAWAETLGARARQTVEHGYAIETTAALCLHAYERVGGGFRQANPAMGLRQG